MNKLSFMSCFLAACMMTFVAVGCSSDDEDVSPSQPTDVKVNGSNSENGSTANNNSQTDDEDFDEKQITHDYVDLGLTSGTLWATMNVGARQPEEAGMYFAWGEVTTKKDYSWNTYAWYDGTKAPPLTKYCTKEDYGKIDSKSTLAKDDDVAYVRWGEDWRMPSKNQMEELWQECTWTWTEKKQCQRL